MENAMAVMKTMKTAMVLPSSKSPQLILPLGSLDLFKPNIQAKFVFFYKSNGYSNVLDFKLLREALARTLVPFYPFAGRLRRDENGRVEIICNDEGVLLVEVEADATIEDFGDFAPSLKLNQLLHHVDYTKDISSQPILHLQVTRFKCGGASLGVGWQEYIGDAQTFIDFINSWSRIARGEDINIYPSIDRTILQARVPPTPVFPHKEFAHPPLKNKNPKQSSTSTSLLKVTRAQLDLIKAKCKGEANTFLSLTSYVWQCVTRARRLSEDQDTKLIIPYSGREILPLSSAYLGNVIFLSTITSKARKVLGSDNYVLAREIKENFNVMTEEYMRSTIDFLELQIQKTSVAKEDEEEEEVPVSIFVMNDGLKFPHYDADFGWGKPIYVGPTKLLEDICTVIPSSPMNGDGSVFLVLELKEDHMLEFKKLFYELLQ